MRDFTLRIYHQLLDAFQESGTTFLPYRDFHRTAESRNPELRTLNPELRTLNSELRTLNSELRTENPLVLLRHDVDRLPLNSLRFAQIQHERGIRGTYYFRMVPQSFDEAIIRQIAELGHEIGYHYETMDTSRGDVERAWDEFRRNLERLRRIVPIDTICMHGSPLSRHDNRTLWQHYDYRSLDIIAEPYLDLDFTRIAYYTDTGRRWDGERVSVRDKVSELQGFRVSGFQGFRVSGFQGSASAVIPAKAGIPTLGEKDTEFQSGRVSGFQGSGDLDSGSNTETLNRAEGELGEAKLETLKLPSSWPKYHTTLDMIAALKANTFPTPAMLTFHPQRWSDRAVPWIRELVVQKMKNVVKRAKVGHEARSRKKD
jgi:hypothetical protein